MNDNYSKQYVNNLIESIQQEIEKTKNSTPFNENGYLISKVASLVCALNINKQIKKVM